MNATTFDSLRFANRLKAAGFNDAQAEALTELQKEMVAIAVAQAEHEYHLDELATKRDLKELEVNLRHEMELIRAETKRDIAETKAELIRWVVGAGLLQTSLIAGMLMKFAHLI